LVDTDILKYLIQKFEDKIRGNPLSPEFVKLANYYLINGNTREAIDLLKSGLEFHPSYPTARLLLGKAYLAGRYFIDSRRMFEKLLSDYPDMNVARKYLDISVDMSKTDVTRKYDDDIVPKLEFKAPEYNDYEFNYNLVPSYDVEDIISESLNIKAMEDSNEFRDFKNIFESPHYFKNESTSKPSFEKKRLKNKFEVKIITETLADIFAKQGNYFDAIEAYTYLLKIKPERKEALENKIGEVEMQINKLINDF
jgi:tetratricopeptide (TPR) repeat protein